MSCMSSTKGNLLDINLPTSKINNGLNDEEIIIADNDNENDKENTQENDENKNYQNYYNNLYNNTNNFDEIEDDEKSNDTIVVFQEEKNSNLLVSNDNISLLNKNITVENEEEIKNENEKKENLNNNENNDVILKIFAQDKNKLKQIK